MATKQRRQVQEPSDSESGRSKQLDRVWTSETESGACTDASDYTDSESEAGSDIESECEALRKRIEFHKNQGRAKCRRSAWSSSLVAREIEIWKEYVWRSLVPVAYYRTHSCDLRYCLKLNQAKTDNDAFANDTLRKCQPEDIKGYLEWRAKKFRIKKESTIKSYWKRLSCGYIDLAGHRIENGTDLDIRDVCSIISVIALISDYIH